MFTGVVNSPGYTQPGLRKIDLTPLLLLDKVSHTSVLR
ncbi:hypothetical protein UYSO10_5895 [Kosakonia radicincitans]|nr:hypothetical protein UYSO10_5895 [Kosakonia radicincitans]